MAAECPFLEEDLTCPLCYEVFKDPVTLNCNHSFCKRCIHTRWECRGLQHCPVCYRTASSSRPSINRALKRVSDVFKQKPEHFMVKSMKRCSIHNEELKFFCRKDAELICAVCTSTRSHANHNYCSITEATSEILTQAAQTAEEIKKEYEKLHEFLREDERARLIVLKDQTKSKTGMVSEQLEEVNKIIEELTDITNYVEPITIADDLSFLKECKEAIKRTTYIVPEAEYPAGAIIDVFQYLGSLKHGVWKRMERAVNCCPVNFDPNTAHPNLIISDELTTVKYGKQQQVPDNPKRCMSRIAVLAACGFSSGKHCWHVEVDNSEWYIGVARESIRRKSSEFLNPTNGFWVIGLSNEAYRAQTSPHTRLSLKRKPQIVTVELDYEKGKVSFTYTTDGSSIYTFKDVRFKESIFPYFSIGINQGSTLRICAF
ncbi:zinc-binding protein A33-like isoform X2 [Triplophysa rosa]|uniref:zinc-binding protein A33-like isoform X2 n=1 Tax=Triplophysa rosa TaxID=992332 RepID=UPI00254636BD|nr:zinc-binding protein A33-like isoform X2 [Triplophysa rosa]